MVLQPVDGAKNDFCSPLRPLGVHQNVLQFSGRLPSDSCPDQDAWGSLCSPSSAKTSAGFLQVPGFETTPCSRELAGGFLLGCMFCVLGLIRTTLW